MITAKNTLLNVSCCARLTTVETLPTSCQHDTEERVLQCVKIRVCNLNFTSEMATWITRVACEIAFLPLHPDTGALSHSRGNSHLELDLRDVTDGLRSRKLPVDGCDKNCERIQPVVGVGSPFKCCQGRWSRALWLALGRDSPA